MQGPHQRAVSCPLCNEKFFPASLPFHQKQCERRRATRIVNCPYCSIEVSQLKLPDHIKCCPKSAGGKQRSKGADGGGAGRAEGPSEDRNMGPANFDADVMDDGRMRCVYCGRYFAPDRIEKHQSICGKLKSARPVGVDGQPTQEGRKVFNAQAQRTESGAAFVTPQQYKRQHDQKMKAAAEERARRTGSRWRAQHAQFQDVVRAGRNDGTETLHPSRRDAGPPNQRLDDGTTQCPHCSRRFEQSVADRHIPICAKVLNRPKPPPSPGPSSRISPAASSQGFQRREKERNHSSSMPPGTGRRDGPSPRAQTCSPFVQSSGRQPPQEQRRGGNARGSPGTGRLERMGGGTQDERGGGPGGSGRLPSLPRTPQRENSRSSVGARANAAPGGTGIQAARSLRHAESSGRLPGLGTPSSTATEMMSINDGEDPDRTMLRPPKEVLSAHSTDTTDGVSPTQGKRGTVAKNQPPATTRLGLRRSAMLFRLLSQVPRGAMERELAECGVEATTMDEEDMIEAIIEKLA
mmetsp:Transcript_60394/g.168752  ORF Transcript_60394/g.168752 Transcript_60394/m.168752 type:complete len:521 (-) Transcript_60394:98-1660(-)